MPVEFPFSDATRKRISEAVQEDLGSGDLTGMAAVDETIPGKAGVAAKASGILCGCSVFEEVFRVVDPTVRVRWSAADGAGLKSGQQCAVLDGSARAILAAERTALNFLQRMSGIATLTRRFVDRIRHTKAMVIDTRKTTPLWRELEKYSVRAGGGANHRMGLYDMCLIKDNHIAAAGGIANAVQSVLEWKLAHHPDAAVEVEVTSLDQLKEALNFPIQRIMLDNMDLERMKKAVDLVRGRCEVEASGGITLETVVAVAETGVDFISVGALTHSAPALDISLLMTTS